MTLRYKLDQRTGWFMCIGPADEVKLGLVTVVRSNGTEKTEAVIKLGPIFSTANGPQRVGYLRALPRRPNPRPTDQRLETPVYTRTVGGRSVEITVEITVDVEDEGEVRRD